MILNEPEETITRIAQSNHSFYIYIFYLTELPNFFFFEKATLFYTITRFYTIVIDITFSEIQRLKTKSFTQLSPFEKNSRKYGTASTKDASPVHLLH